MGFNIKRFRDPELGLFAQHHREGERGGPTAANDVVDANSEGEVGPGGLNLPLLQI